jgi:hypothetical protein
MILIILIFIIIMLFNKLNPLMRRKNYSVSEAQKAALNSNVLELTPDPLSLPHAGHHIRPYPRLTFGQSVSIQGVEGCRQFSHVHRRNLPPDLANGKGVPPRSST